MNPTDKNGLTPLFLAALNGRTAICEFLVGAGADPSIAVKEGRYQGQTAVDIARKWSRPKIVALFLQEKKHSMSCTRILQRSAPILGLVISVVALYTVVPQA